MLMGAIRGTSRRYAFSRFIFAVIVLAGSVLWQWNASHAAPGRGYEFSNLTAELKSRENLDTGKKENYLDVGFNLAWQSDTFPGLLGCTFSAQARDGSVIAEHSVEVADLTPEGKFGGLTIPLQGSPQRPHRVSVSCDTSRSDSASGTYQVSNVEVQRAPAAEGDLRTFDMTFDHSWTAASAPGVAECVLTVKGLGGETLFTYSFTLSDAQPSRTGASMRVITDADVVGDPSDARVDCQPFA